jgi:AcrR family transcriptional regulator
MARRPRSKANDLPEQPAVEQVAPAEQAVPEAEAPAESITPDALDAAMQMIEADGWVAFSLPALARTLNVPVGEVYGQFPSRAAVLNVLGKRLDAQMLDLSGEELEELNPRERLFELIMRRLDAMKPYKVALKKIARDSRGDLEAALAGFGSMSRAVVELVDAAGLRGPGSLLARHAVGLLYLRVLRVWLDDDDPEQAKTLAELDKGLARMERAAQGLFRFLPKRKAKGPTPAAA